MKDQFIPVPQTTLPGGLVVPAFQVAKFPCGKGKDGKPISTMESQPWVRINFHDANKACEAAGLRLMRESQYLALAYQVSLQDDNWTGGKVGNGKLYQGLRKGRVSSAQPGTYEPTDPDERRFFTLPGGHRIYDIAGNVWEWSFDDIQGNDKGLVAKSFSADSASIVIPYPGEEKGQGWTSNAGANWSGFALFRGGCWNSEFLAGAFRLGYGWPGNAGDNVGFRCTKPGL